MLGRVFGTNEDRAPGGNPVVVLSHAYWQRQFRGDPQALGKIIRIGNTSFTIIGVAPREFTGTSLNPQVPDLWAPVSMQQQLVPGQDWLHKPTDFEFQFLARLDPGVGFKQAQAKTDALIRQFAATYVSRDHTLFYSSSNARPSSAIPAILVFALAWVP